MTQKNSDSPLRRRAVNMVWTAAGAYDFDPLFLFFYQDGKPDFYMNSITGYVYKWMEPEVFFRLFDSTEGAEHQEMYDGLIWLALESWVYKREASDRPVLSELRLIHAEEFFAHDKDSSMQQWLSRDSLVYMIQSARWRTLLGKSDGLLSARDRELYHALDFDGGLSSQEVYERIQEIFAAYLPFSRRFRKRLFVPDMSEFLTRALPFRMVRAELVPASADVGKGEDDEKTPSGHRKLRLIRHGRRQTEAEVRAYLEECFGKSLYADAENNRLEHRLCTDRHSQSRLFFTAGEKLDPSHLKTETGAAAREIAAQTARNQAHYQAHLQQYETSIKALSHMIQNAMFVYTEPTRIRAKSGRLDPSAVWRAVYLNDERVFHAMSESTMPEFSVDLMLDASSSRSGCQELLASQAYVIARSLKLLNLPVQVYSFQSLRGHTVMNRFLSYSESDTRRIFHYYAAGWNRDGLAFKAAGHLMSASPSPNRILIVLTDANPNDDESIPANVEAGRYFAEDYSRETAVRDTEEEVQRLRKSGVRVIGILTRDSRRMAAAKRIFGEDFVCIRSIGDLAGAVGALLLRQIRLFHETVPPG